MPLMYYYVIINIIAFCLMGADKRRAKKKMWRISEKTLFAAALLGGALGATVGMNTFRHKTRHWYFKYGLPLLTLVQAALLIYYYG